jgi:hypothetical protein
MVYHLHREISEAGHKILLLIWNRGQKGLSFNELRRAPYISKKVICAVLIPNISPLGGSRISIRSISLIN